MLHSQNDNNLIQNIPIELLVDCDCVQYTQKMYYKDETYHVTALIS